MVASHDTTARILELILRHITVDELRAIIKDLRTIPGSKSFRETIQRMERQLDE